MFEACRICESLENVSVRRLRRRDLVERGLFVGTGAVPIHPSSLDFKLSINARRSHESNALDASVRGNPFENLKSNFFYDGAGAWFEALGLEVLLNTCQHTQFRTSQCHKIICAHVRIDDDAGCVLQYQF